MSQLLTESFVQVGDHSGNVYCVCVVISNMHEGLCTYVRGIGWFLSDQ